MNNSLYGVSMALLATMSWAIGAILFKKWGEKLEPVALTTLNSLFSCICLFIILFCSQLPIMIPKSSLIPIAQSGILGIVIGDSLYYASLNRLSPVMLSIILLAGPFFSGIFGLIFFNEIPSIYSVIGIVTILIGTTIILLASGSKLKNAKTTMLGVFLGLSSLCLTSFSMALLKPVLQSTPSLTVTMYRMLFSGLALLLYAVITKKIFTWVKVLLDKMFTLKLLGTMIIYAVGGFWCSVIAVKYCELVIASSIMSLEPFFILLIMILFYRYVPQKRELASILLVVTGILLLCIG